MKMNDLPLAIAIGVSANVPIYIWGARGSGKTQLVASAARVLGRQLITKRPVTMDALDGPGLPFVTTDKQTDYALPKWLPREPNSIVFFDEFAQAPMIVANSLSEFILEGTVNGPENYTRPPNTGIVCASNRRADKCGTTELANHMKNRFVHVYPELDPLGWASASLLGFPDQPLTLPTPTPDDFARARQLVVAYIRHRPGNLSIFGQHEMANNESASPRTWSFVIDLLPYLFHTPEIMFDMINGCVGAPSSEFVAFIQTATKMPNPDECLANPTNAPIPNMEADDGPAIAYALCAALVPRVHAKNNNNFFKYVSRLPPEFSSMVILDASWAFPKVAECQAGRDYFVANSKYMLSTRA